MCFLDKYTHDIEKQKILAKVHTGTQIKDVIMLALKLVTVCVCIYLIMTNLVLMADKNPTAISAIAEVIAKLKVSNIILYVLTACGVGYGYFERKGKKRAISQMANYQQQLESSDPYRGSSKLTRQGDTPKSKGAKR